MPAVVQLEVNKDATKSFRSPSKTKKLPSSPVQSALMLPLPPLTTQVQQDLKVILKVDLSKPTGLRLNNECRIVEIFPTGQFGNIASGVKIGYVVDIVDEDIVLTYKDFQNNMKQARERGYSHVNIRCRPPKDSDPIRPYILQSLKNLEAQDEFELNFKDANIKFNENKSTSQIVYERGMKSFRSILKHIESGDYTWETCPPRAKESLEMSRANIESSARRKYGPALNHMGCLCATGTHPIPKDLTQAADWFKLGADYNDADAQYNYANALFNGLGVDRNHVKAAQYLIQSAENGHSFAQSLSGLVYTHGSGVPTNVNKAAEYWKEAARQREPEAEYRLAEAFQHAIGFSNRNPDFAEDLFRRAANAGQAEASTVVGRMFQEDPSTLNEAIALTSTGAKRSHPPAMYDLAVMYHEGKKLPQSDDLAFSWALAAAKKKHAESCRLVAEALYQGWGGEEQLKSMKEHEEAKERLKSEEYFQLEEKVKYATKVEEDWLEARKLRLIEARKLRELQMMEERAQKFKLEKEEQERKEEAEAGVITALEAREREEKAALVAIEEEKIRMKLAIEAKMAGEIIEQMRLANEEAEKIKLAIQSEKDLKQRERELLIKNEEKEEMDAILEGDERLEMRSEDVDINQVTLLAMQQVDKLFECKEEEGKEVKFVGLTKDQAVRCVFHRFDVEKIGEVNAKESIGALLIAYGLKLTPNRYGDILNLYETQQSPYFHPGYLSLHEVHKLCILGKSVETFDFLDVAKDGNLAEDDVQDYMKSIGVNVSLEQCTIMMKDISTDGDGVVSLSEFVNFFRYLPVETRLRAEAEVLKAKEGETCSLDLSLKLGMVVNPNCQVSKITEGGQAEKLGIKLGCILTHCGGREVKSLDEIKNIIKQLKEDKAKEEEETKNIIGTSEIEIKTKINEVQKSVSTSIICSLRYFDPKKVAGTAAALGALKAKGAKIASQVAETEAVEAKKSKRRSQLLAASIARENEDGKYRAEQRSFESKLKRCFLDVSQGGLEGVCEQKDLVELFHKMELGLNENEMKLTMKYGLDSRRKVNLGLSLIECKSTLRVARLILAFNQMDIDKSGFISEDEMMITFKQLGFRIKPMLCNVIMQKMDPNGDGVVSLNEFVDFFRYLPVETRLRAEAEVLKAKEGETCSLDLSLKLGIVVNPDGLVSKVTVGSQAEAMDIAPGCRVVACGGKKVKTLKDIKQAISEAKALGVTNCLLHFYDPRVEYRAIAQLAKLRVDASEAAVIAAREAEMAAEKTRLKREQEAFEIGLMHERQRKEAKEKAEQLALTHERERIAAYELSMKNAEEHRIARAAAEEEAKMFEIEARKAQEAAAAEVERLAQAERDRRKHEEEEKIEADKLYELKREALKAMHDVELAEVEAGRRKEESILKAKSEAFKWWEKASAYGCLDASNDLAMCLSYGNGCEPDVKRAAEVWEDAIGRGHVPSMYHFAMAFINRTGVNLKFAGGPYGNLERATELLVASAYKGYQQAREFLYEAQPLSYQSVEDFEPKPMPLMCFADSIIGKRVQVRNYKKGIDKRYPFNGWYGTVESVKPAGGKFYVRMQDYSIMSFNRNNLCRPFIALLSDEIIKKAPPPPPEELVIKIDPKSSLGLDIESDSLLIIKVELNSQAWLQGVRPGQNIHKVQGIPVKDLEETIYHLKSCKERGDKVCEITILIFPYERQGGLF